MKQNEINVIYSDQSNEFVSDSKESPVQKIKTPKKFQLYHFSWTYLLTVAHILLFDNGLIKMLIQISLFKF